MVDVGIVKQTFHTFPLCVSNENLSEMVVADQTDQFHHALVVQLVENVIQKQNGLVANLLIVKLELSQAYRHDKRFLLALRTEFLQLMSIKFKLQIVLMDANIRVT